MSAKQTLGLAAILVLVLAGGTAYAAYSGQGTYDQTKTVDAATISSIIVQVQDVNVHVTPTNDNRITAHFYGQGAKDAYVLNTKSDGSKTQYQIEIDSPQRLWHWSLYQNLTLDVMMPKKMYEQMTVNASSGNLQVDGMQTSGNIALYTSSGKISAQDIQCDKFGTTSSSGNINLNQIRGGAAAFQTSSGNVNVQGLQVDALTAQSSSGNLELDQITSGDTTTHSSSGNVQLLFAKSPQSVNVNTSSGNAKLFLPSDSSFALDYTTGSGDQTVDFPIHYDRQDKHSGHGTVGQGGATVQVHTSSGNLSVLKN